MASTRASDFNFVARGSVLILVFITTLTASVSAQDSRDAYRLFRAGKPEEAQLLFTQAVENARTTKNRYALWGALINLAWYYDERGQHTEARKYSNEALKIARSVTPQNVQPSEDSRFMVGRSLSWLGWSFQRLGLYDVAIRFYQEAVTTVGDEPQGRLLNVWGLSTQELGSIFYAQGDVTNGRRLVRSAYDVAVKRDISVGVIETGLLLAEFALDSGKLDEAREYALEVAKAAKKGQPSVVALTKSALLSAEVEYLLALRSPKEGRDELLKAAEQRLDEALALAESRKVIRPLAEGLLFQSRKVQSLSLDHQLARAGRAVALLEHSESELRGSASAAVGAILLESERVDLARFYLEQGLQVNAELLRERDTAFVVADLATLEGFMGNTPAQLKKLVEAANRAKATENPLLELETIARLVKELREQGYLKLVRDWSGRGTEVVKGLAADKLDSATRERVNTLDLLLRQSAAEAILTLLEEPTDLPVE